MIILLYKQQSIIWINKMNDKDTKAIKEAVQRLLKDLERKKGFVCRYCGKQASKPHGGKCQYSPHPNKCHEFIKA